MRRADVASLNVRIPDLEAHRLTSRAGRRRAAGRAVIEELARVLRPLIGKRATGPCSSRTAEPRSLRTRSTASPPMTASSLAPLRGAAFPEA